MKSLQIGWSVALAILTSGSYAAQNTARYVGQFGESAAVTALAISSDGRTVAVGRGDGTVIRFPYPDGLRFGTPFFGATKRLDQRLENATPIAFSADLRLLAAFGNGKAGERLKRGAVEIRDLETGETKHTLLLTDPRDIGVGPLEATFSPSGDFLAVAVSAFYYGGTELFDVREGKSLRVLEEIPGDQGSTGGVTCVAFSPDEETLAANDWVSIGKVLRPVVGLWDRDKGTWRATIHTGKDETLTRLRFAFSPTGDLLAVKDRREIAILKTSSGERLRTIEIAQPMLDLRARSMAYWPEDPSAIVFSPDARLLVSCNEGVVEVWDVSTGTRAYDLQISVPATEVAFFPDGKMLACGYLDGTVKFWSLDQSK